MSNTQITSLCVGFSWASSNQLLKDPKDFTTTAEASGSSLDASDVGIITEKSAIMSISTPSLFIRESLTLMLFSHISSLLKNESDKSSDLWSPPLDYARREKDKDKYGQMTRRVLYKNHHMRRLSLLRLSATALLNYGAR
ncbi:hypothetical protein Moror_14664, partial [Moniliophthora roreri MCA 2997]